MSNVPGNEGNWSGAEAYRLPSRSIPLMSVRQVMIERRGTVGGSGGAGAFVVLLAFAWLLSGNAGVFAREIDPPGQISFNKDWQVLLAIPAALEVAWLASELTVTAL